MRYTGISRLAWPGMVSEYAVLGPGAAVTTTGTHQIGIEFSGHRGLVREVDGHAERYDAEPGAVYVTGPSPITWLEVADPVEALEIYPDRALVGRLAGESGGSGEVRPAFAVCDGIVFAAASRLRRAHLATATGEALTDIEASTLAHQLVRHMLRRYGTGPEPGRKPTGVLRPGAVDVVAEYIRAHLADVITLDGLAGGGEPERVPLRPFVPRDDRPDAARLRHRAPADGRARPAAARRRERDRSRPSPSGSRTSATSGGSSGGVTA